MENKKLYLFEDKVGTEWYIRLAETYDARMHSATVFGTSDDLTRARFNFLANLEKAINEGSITVFSGKVTLIDP